MPTIEIVFFPNIALPGHRIKPDTTFSEYDLVFMIRILCDCVLAHVMVLASVIVLAHVMGFAHVMVLAVSCPLGVGHTA